MFEMLMLTAFLCAGFCHLLPEERETAEGEPQEAEKRDKTSQVRSLKKSRAPSAATYRKKTSGCGRRYGRATTLSAS